MGSVKICLVLAVIISMVGRAYPAAGDLAAACTGAGACTDATNHVCDTVASECRVKADGTATDCASTNSNCPTDATCGTDKCSCDTGFRVTTSGLCTAVIDSTCSTDTECSTALMNTYCEITYPCTKGTCACASGLSGADCATLGYDKTCQTGNDLCGTGLSCAADTSKCACDAGTYKTDVSACTDKAVFGETCTTDANCYIPNGSNGDCIDDLCDCESGYVQDTATSGSQSCRRPYANEVCNDTCIEVPFDALTGEASQVAPTCDSNTCVCASSGETLYSRKKGSVCYDFCLTDPASGGELAAGDTCTAFNQCASKICAECPGDANGKCYDATCGVGVNENGIALCLIILLLSYFF